MVMRPTTPKSLRQSDFARLLSSIIGTLEKLQSDPAPLGVIQPGVGPGLLQLEIFAARRLHQERRSPLVAEHDSVAMLHEEIGRRSCIDKSNPTIEQEYETWFLVSDCRHRTQLATWYPIDRGDDSLTVPEGLQGGNFALEQWGIEDLGCCDAHEQSRPNRAAKGKYDTGCERGYSCGGANYADCEKAAVERDWNRNRRYGECERHPDPGRHADKASRSPHDQSPFAGGRDGHGNRHDQRQSRVERKYVVRKLGWNNFESDPRRNQPRETEALGESRAALECDDQSGEHDERPRPEGHGARDQVISWGPAVRFVSADEPRQQINGYRLVKQAAACDE